jgi:hypothetical protein
MKRVVDAHVGHALSGNAVGPDSPRLRYGQSRLAPDLSFRTSCLQPRRFRYPAQTLRADCGQQTLGASITRLVGGFQDVRIAIDERRARHGAIVAAAISRAACNLFRGRGEIGVGWPTPRLARGGAARLGRAR